MLAETLQSKDIYIIFGGPSLKGFDFSRLNDKVTLACNRCAEHYPATAMISIDKTYCSVAFDFIKQFPGYTVFALRDMEKLDRLAPDFRYVHRRDSRLSEDPAYLYGLNTGHAAVNFALLQGFKTIHALGLDMGRRGHWHRGYTHSRQDDRMLSKWALDLDLAKPILDRNGVEMINYNPESAVRAYPFRDLAAL